MGNLKEVEKATLETFVKHRPSEYFSHLDSDVAFHEHHKKVERLYRLGLCMPPEFFRGKTVVDLGAGTGENTISLATWGANCTLVEMNSDAIQVAEKVFAERLESTSNHRFICQSLFDLDTTNLNGTFDFSHSRGVFTHVADKQRAFGILSGLAKPGGYVIYGDRNTAGGAQEMLQRFAIYWLAKSHQANLEEAIVQIAEALFESDIDRSQKSVPRTRKAIIFDRWVIQQQNDPSAGEVLSMMRSQGLEYVSSWPRIDFAGRGNSTYSEPLNWENLSQGAATVELLWMLMNKGEAENIQMFFSEVSTESVLAQTDTISQKLRNLQSNSTLLPDEVLQAFQIWSDLSDRTSSLPSKLQLRIKTFAFEVKTFVSAISEGRSLVEIRQLIDNFQILFKNYAGIRHVDYLAYKPESF